MVLAVGYFACFTALSLLRFEGFHSRSFDLAIAVRMLWGLRRAELQDVFLGEPWIANHFEPILFPLCLIDALLPAGSGLLVLQTAALALAALPAYRLGTRLLGPWAGTAGTAAVLLHPVLGQVNVFEFHPVALAVAPGLWMLDALDRGAHRQVATAACLVAACREDGLVFVALALASLPLPADRTARWRRMAVASGFLAAYMLYAFVLRPRMGGFASVRVHLGATAGEAISGALRDPLRLLVHVFSPEKLLYLVALLAPVAFLPLAAPRRALPALFTVAVNLFSGFPAAAEIVDSHYSALALPGLVAGALFGAARVTRLLGASHRARGGPLATLAAAASAGALLWGAFPGARGHHAEDYVLDERAQALRRLVAPIRAAPSASASVPIDVVAHVARRRRPHVFPAGLPNGDFAVADLATQGLSGWPAERLAARFAAHVERARHAGMTVYAVAGPLVALRRGSR